MTYQIVDPEGQIVGEFDDYGEAAEWRDSLNDQLGSYAELRCVSD